MRVRTVTQDDFDFAVKAQIVADTAVTNLVAKLRSGASAPADSDIAGIYARWALLERTSPQRLRWRDVRTYYEHISAAKRAMPAGPGVWFALFMLALRAFTLPYPLAGVKHETLILVYLRSALEILEMLPEA